MNIRIISLAIAAALFCSAGASAKTTKCDSKCPNIQNCDPKKCKGPKECKNEKCKKNDCKDCTRRANCTKGMGMNPFEGLGLSEKQITAIKAVPTPGQVMKEASKNREKGQDMRAIQRTVRADYLKNIKKILSKEQYTQFLENFYVDSSKAARPGMKHDKQGKNRKQNDGKRKMGGRDNKGPRARN